MTRWRWFFHPILILIFSILALGTSLILYIYWYIEASTGLKAIVERFNLDSGQILSAQTWVVILVLSILVGIILMGIFIIFVYNQKTLQLYRLQHNFINNFTHELKTPVTSLKLYLETFMKHDLHRKDQLKYIEYMVSDVDRLSDNINRILNLAKIESKSYVSEFVDTELIRTIKRFCDNNLHMFQGCEININVNKDAAFLCRINQSLFEMLLVNIITNAINYNESEMPKVDISFEPMKKKVVIFFKDNGIGFEKSERKKIFRKFYQVGRSDDMSAMGTGIGLYMADSVVRIHKGKISAESPGYGKGSTFRLVLPVRN